MVSITVDHLQPSLCGERWGHYRGSAATESKVVPGKQILMHSKSVYDRHLFIMIIYSHKHVEFFYTSSDCSNFTLYGSYDDAMDYISFHLNLSCYNDKILTQEICHKLYVIISLVRHFTTPKMEIRFVLNIQLCYTMYTIYPMFFPISLYLTRIFFTKRA